MASGWNLWVWLECIGVVSGFCCKEVYIYRYPHNNWSEPERAPHLLYCCAKSSLYVPFVRLYGNLVPRRAPNPVDICVPSICTASS